MNLTTSLRKLFILTILCAVQLALGQQSEFRLAPLIAENMVIQRESDVRFWGWGKPGTDVRIQSSWQAAATARVQQDGTWITQLRSPKAGGPFQITFSHAEGTVTLNNVLSGEVWLCSGQSNMEMTLAGWPPTDTIQNSAAEIARSANPQIRMFTVQRTYSAFPESSCKGEWLESSSATSPNFGATAYFFGKKLHEALGVPVGLIQTSWGGTAVHSWIGARYLSGQPQFTETLSQLKGGEEGQRQLVAWLTQFPVIDMDARQGADKWKNLNFGDTECAMRSYNDTQWRVMKLPSLWELAGLGNMDGAVWFRKRVEIPESWVEKKLTLRVGQIDDMDVTYVNGVRVGGQEELGHWRDERVYAVPASLIKDRAVQIAVRVVDNQGGGGIYGNPETMSLSAEGETDTLSLAGEWKYHVSAFYRQNVFYLFGQKDEYGAKPKSAFDMDPHLPTVLYNGMIAPLIPYTVRGAIWYQGESDVGNPEQYRTLFPLMIENWRNDFKLGDFPFYYVQIAPFDYGTNTNSAFLREAQLHSLSVKNTGMAVTLDIGNAKNIHPSNKQDVGDRLARWALTKTYGKNVVYSGPVYVSMRKSGSAVELTFDHAQQGLVLKSPAGFQIAGADRVFIDAEVRVDGAKLIVSHPEIASPEAVRYAFTNTPEATLLNAEGLPASSFRTDQWK